MRTASKENKRAEILRRLRRGQAVRAICAALRCSASTVAAVAKAHGLRRKEDLGGEHPVKWITRLPDSLSKAADKARGRLSRSAYLCAVLTRTLDAEERREGP